MSDSNIVKNLRQQARGPIVRSGQMVMLAAADEIERLRGLLKVQNEQVRHHVAERDLARREICRLEAAMRGRDARDSGMSAWFHSPQQIAGEWGWDCFKEKDGGAA